MILWKSLLPQLQVRQNKLFLEFHWAPVDTTNIKYLWLRKDSRAILWSRERETNDYYSPDSILDSQPQYKAVRGAALASRTFPRLTTQFFSSFCGSTWVRCTSIQAQAESGYCSMGLFKPQLYSFNSTISHIVILDCTFPKSQVLLLPLSSAVQNSLMELYDKTISLPNNQSWSVRHSYSCLFYWNETENLWC